LFALIRVDQQYDFVMTHSNSLWITQKIGKAAPGV